MRLDGDDAAFLRPDLLEQRDEQPAPLGRLGLQLRERGEVAGQFLDALDARVGGSAEALQLLLDGLARMTYCALGSRRCCGELAESSVAGRAIRPPPC